MRGSICSTTEKTLYYKEDHKCTVMERTVVPCCYISVHVVISVDSTTITTDLNVIQCGHSFSKF